jgi:chloramphenicol O-acetyltransferase
MYIGFELNNLKEECFNSNFERCLQIGNNDFENYKIEIKETLNEFINANGSIDGDKMQSTWFPYIDADIFLSHSHADENLVIAFAGWLKEVFGLKVFIDSCIWGNSKNLQKIMDDKYNKIQDNLYKYDNVLYASSHVHMMLNTALMQMIDTCECIIFINTPNSVKPREVIDKVISPWIYSELGMTKLIRKKSIGEHRVKKLHESNKTFSDLTIEYNLATDHLIQLTIDDLSNWEKKQIEKKQMTSLKNYFKSQLYNINENHLNSALDCLYELKNI